MIAICIASHERLEVVEQNIAHLQTMGEIFLCVSENSERVYLQAKFPKAHIGTSPNYPLGNKWQSAVMMAKQHNPDYLVICGSDDFLQEGYIDNCIKITYKGFHFIGVNTWYLTDGLHHYKAKYKHLQHFPAGSGRFFTSAALDAIKYQIFDTTANRHLDDQAIQRTHDKRVKTYVSQDSEKDGLGILAVKGNWACLNPMNKFLKAESIKIQELKELPKEFPKVTL